MNFKDQQNSTGGIRNTINELSKLSDEELSAELTRQLKIKKENGSLSDIEKIVRMIGPFLTQEQKDRLAKIVKSMQQDE